MRLVQILMVGLAAAAVVEAPRDARADTRIGVAIVLGHHDGDAYGYGRSEAYRFGFDRGYRDGYDHGRKDGRRGDSFDFAHDKRFRRADAGYRRWYGPKYEYARGYRRGYEQGYGRAYAAYGPRYDRYRHGDRWRRDDPYRSDERYRYDRDRDWDRR